MSKLFHEIIPNDLGIDFMGKSKFMMILAGLLVVASLVLVATRGLNYGVDFEGGTQLNLRFHSRTPAGKIREALSQIKLEEAVVQEMGEQNETDFLVRVPTAALDLKKFEKQLQIALDAVSPPDGGKARIRFSEDRFYVRYDRSADPEKIKAAVNSLNVTELNVHSVDLFGRAVDNEYRIQISGAATRIISALEDKFGKQKFEVLQVDYVGPKVGAELRMQAIGAVLISLILILIYVWFRFEFEFAPGAVICLFHDAIIIVGVFSAFQLTFDLSIVAAILTIIGFSINDTIVVYDRIRENLQRTRNPDLGQVINESINQTLSRTILTSGTVLLTSLALVIFGGPITFNFALAFTIGLFAGTYSSISVAAPITMYLRAYLDTRHKKAA